MEAPSIEMEARSMEITVISARHLNNKNSKCMFFKSKAYAVAWISNDNKGRQRTRLGKHSGTDPIWNHLMNFTLNEASLQEGLLVLDIAIYRDATFRDKEIGRVSIPLREFLKSASDNRGASASEQFFSFQVQEPSGELNGVLYLSVKLSEKPEHPHAVPGSSGAAKAEPVTADPGSSGADKAEPMTADPAYI